MPLSNNIIGLAVVVGGLASLPSPAAAQIPTRSFDHTQQRTAPQQAAWNGAQPSPAEPRRLMPTAYQAPTEGVAPAPLQQPLPLARPAAPGANDGKQNLKPLATGAASLGLVLGLFLLVVWSVRRGMTKGTGLLPSAAVEVLGQTTIGARQQIHLVRCGNKLVLLSATGASVETLTEISDPDEVARLQEICRHTTAPASALKQLLGRFGAPSFAPMHADSAQRLDFDHLQSANYRRA